MIYVKSFNKSILLYRVEKGVGMKTCWVIYTYKDRLSGFNAKKFAGDTYEEIENDAKAWHVRNDNIEMIDVAETVYNDEY